MKKLSLVIALLVWSGKGMGLDLKALQDSLHKMGDPWIAGSTSVSHLSYEEKQRIFGGCPKPSRRVLHKGASTRKLSKRKPPTTWDWSDHTDGYNWMSSVKHQGSCGSCTFFAITACFEGVIKIANQTPGANPNLAEQMQVSCDENHYGYGGCKGGYAPEALDYLKYTGLPDEACYPYVARDWREGAPCSDRCSDWQSRVTKLLDWGYCSGGTEGYKNAIMEGPLRIGVTAKEDFFYYKGGVYKPVMGEWMKSNHAVCCVGWTSSGNWIIKNSYGSGWGSGGYGTYGTEIDDPHWLEVTPSTVPSIDVHESECLEPNNGVWDPGETASFVVTLGNIGVSATNVAGVLSTTDPNVNMVNNTANFGSIPKGGYSDNLANPYSATASAGAPDPHEVQFRLHVTADGGYSRNIDFAKYIGWKPGVTVKEFRASGDIIPYSLGFDGTYLWATDFAEPYIFKFDQSGNAIAQIPTPNSDTMCTGLDYDCVNDVLWVHNKMQKRIFKVNPSDGSVISSFSTPASSYPTGLAFDGEHLWAVDRDAYEIYKLTTDGSVVTSFPVPISPKPYYGPRGLAFDPHGPNGGTLILVMTYFNVDVELDSTRIHEITRTGSLIAEHVFDPPGVNGRAIEVNPSSSYYWTSSWYPPQVYKVMGFYRPETSVEEILADKASFGLSVSPNPFARATVISFRTSEKTLGNVSVQIHDLSGRLVRTLNLCSPGESVRSVSWDGTDNAGKRLPKGIYFSRLESGESVFVKKTVLLQ
jgi:hypothetical protein